MRKLIAADIDGTLINSKNQVTEETVHWVQKAKEKGCSITLLSARAYPLMKRVMEALGLDECYAAANSGGDLRRWPSDERLYTEGITAEQVKDIQRFADEHDLYVQAVRADGEYYYSKWSEHTGFYEEYFHYTGEKADMTCLPFDDIVKCMLFMEPERTEHVISLLEKEFEGRGLRYERIWPTIVDVLPDTSNKGTAVKKLAEILGIPREDIISFGDELVDVPMFKESGTGVAMGNASDRVKAEADAVTLTNEENGVAHYLKEMLEREE
ncbi:MAG: HAD family phosphatase [Lachnospiraceae bacterium]|nr:HAD family phosphatase [Lachnospiraceae bacterium]